MITVRALNPSDLGRILAIQAELGLPAWTETQFLAEIARPEIVRIWVAEQWAAGTKFGKILGYALFHLVGDEAELLTLAVGLAHQRQRVATQLWEDSKRSLLAEGMQSCFLEVRRSNEGAQGFYKRVGFRPVGERKRYYADGEDALLLVWANVV